MSCPLGRRAGDGPPSPRQLETLQAIERRLDARGFPPTIGELLIALGLSPNSRQTIHEHLSRLVAKGMIERRARAHRGLTLTTAARELLARLRAEHTRETNP